MFTLFFAIIFGVALALFAIQNTGQVTLVVANIPFSNIPLWVIIIGSTLVGLIFASYFNIINIISSKFQLHDKDNSLKGADKRITDLRDEIKSLKAENVALKRDNNSQS